MSEGMGDYSDGETGQRVRVRVRARVAVVGSGLISRAVADVIAREAYVSTGATGAAITAEDLRRCAALVVAADGADTGCHPCVMSTATQTGTPWLPVRVELGSVIIGPAVVPGEPGCVMCAASRRHTAQQKARLLRDAQASFAGRLRQPDPWLTSAAACVAAELAADEVHGLIAGGGPRRTRGTAVHLRLDTLATSTHRFIPVASCGWCGTMPDDSAEAADIRLTRPRPKRDRRTYRLRDLADSAQELTAVYVDEEYGLIASLDDDVVPPYPCVSAPFTTPRTEQGGYGRELSYPAARMTGLTEAVERLGGRRPRGRRTVVRGCFRELSADALDPATTGIYTDDRYFLPGFPFQRYHDDLDIDWVWGYSFARSAPLLVPESLAYYGISDRVPEGRPFVHETSNGCAVGGCLEEGRNQAVKATHLLPADRRT